MNTSVGKSEPLSSRLTLSFWFSIKSSVLFFKIKLKGAGLVNTSL